ncbi:MAG: flavodoxin [Selenomonas sp.]|uniref:flavodoxin n=1 Tax=Selenomonas sp. TaxID=2053611 RepID=UPI0025E23FFE|nr:flavodoxin [Selenomonas sp.]MCR5440206.1 flavodoxin [Selenomonas sp.]
MKKMAIIYWSGTGNTQAMAEAIAEGAKAGGDSVELFEVEQFDKKTLDQYDGLLFGCPAMGDEVLEEGTYEPFFTEVEKGLKDRPVALFGSYGWGGGAWMKDWEDRVRNDGAKLFADGLAIENTPDDEGVAACQQLGKDFAASL